MKSIQKECGNCGESFDGLLKEHKRGGALYCCQSCATESLNKKRAWAKANKFPNCVCATCAKTFHRSPSKIGKSKSGFTFCTRVCKEQAQTSHSKLRIAEIIPDHYGNGNSTYRKRAIDSFGAACMACGYDKHVEIIHVHHKDRDRNNGSLDNLEVLCIRCHMENHLAAGDGPFRN